MHISFVMDGNGRWAELRGLPRSAGHRAGAKTLRRIVTALGNLGVDEATFYAFSTENWNRPKTEVGILMRLLEEYLKTQVKEVHKQGGVFRMIGFREHLPTKIRTLIEDAEELTANNTGIRMNIAFNYGGRAEIVEAARRIAHMVKERELDPDQIDEDLFQSQLILPRSPDLLIRTGGEQRLSNYLLWQHSYSEFMFLDTLWPDFSEEILFDCMKSYERRDRRFGGLHSEDRTAKRRE